MRERVARLADDVHALLVRGVEMAKEATLQAKFAEKELRLLNWWAKKNNKTLGSFVYETMLGAVPKHARETIANVEDHEAALDAAFEALDQIEYEATGEKPYQAPAPIVQPGKQPRIQTHSNHPCVHLSVEFGARYSKKDCSGTCRHPQRNGSVCFWSSMAAHMCPMYRAKRGLAAVGGSR